MTEPELKMSSSASCLAIDAGDLRRARRAPTASLGWRSGCGGERVGDEAGHHDAGEVGRGLRPSRRNRSATMVQVEPTGSLMKRIGCWRVERAEAVVVDDLGDGDLVGAGDGLGELVVVDEHEAGGHGLEEVGLGEDALQRARRRR
jgi:hypothetical protein